MYSYDPQGMTIFEMTCIKRNGEKDSGGHDGASRGLFIPGSDKSQAYHPLFGVVEALDELNCSTLACSAGAHEGCGLARLHRHTQLVQDLQGN